MADNDFFMAQDAILTPSEAAAYLRISRRTLQSLRNLNQGPAFFKVKGSFRYTKAALDEYIVKQTNEVSNFSKVPPLCPMPLMS